MSRVTIVGAGVMGTATAWPLSDNGHEVRLVGTHLDGDIIKSCKISGLHPRLKRRLPPGVTPFYVEELETALDGADFILSGVNSMGVRWIGRTLAPYLKPGSRLIAVTKGLEADESGNLLILPEVLRSELPEGVRDQVSLAAIGGPCIAGELAARRPTCVFFGCRELETAQFLANVFRTSYYHIQTTQEIAALEVAVSLKNAYAMAVSLAAGWLQVAGGPDEAGAHMHNPAAALFAQAVFEMGCIMKALGLRGEYASGLPGVGDMFVTCRGGRSSMLGSLMGEGKTYQQGRAILKGETLEAALIVEQMAIALPKLEARSLLSPGDIPLMRALIEVVAHGQPLDVDFDLFFR